jgi:hypothetical protein
MGGTTRCSVSSIGTVARHASCFCFEREIDPSPLQGRDKSVSAGSEPEQVDASMPKLQKGAVPRSSSDSLGNGDLQQLPVAADAGGPVGDEEYLAPA